MNRYERIIEQIFLTHYQDSQREVRFVREDIERVAAQLGIRLPKNIGDVLYSFRYRTQLPQTVREKAPAGEEWVIVSLGRAQYAFVAAPLATITPRQGLVETNIPDATPGIIIKYALSDEQALLAKLRYNRLVDIFTGVTCYALQSHLRTTVPNIGQVETDELYVGVDRRGVQYVFPVQAKGGRDTLSIVQITQDFALCEAKFPALICIPIAAQFMADEVIALFAFERNAMQISVSAERHYRLVAPEQITAADLQRYQARAAE